MHRRFTWIFAVVATFTLGVSVVVAGNGPLSAELQVVRAAVARYNSVVQAERDGYVAASSCVASPAGTMGIHYVNRALVAEPGNDPVRPELLLYLPDANGDLKLVGVEYMSIDADQDLTTAGDRPTIFGMPFDGPMPAHEPGGPIHYDFHVWIFEANPSGVFAQWNPAISCP